MPIIKITKKDVENAKKARETALKKDPDFRATEEEIEKEEKKALEHMKKEVE